MVKGNQQRKWQINTSNLVDQSATEQPLGLLDTPSVSTSSSATTTTGNKSDTKSSSQTATATSTTVDNKKRSMERELKEKKVWEIGQAPFKNLLLKAFLLWMSGNQIHIFPIIITVMAIVEPLKALFSTNTAFEAFEKEKISTTIPKLMYVLLNSAGVGIALAKCYWLGFFEGGAYQPVPLSSQISFPLV